jgi:hypothetical protein
MTEGYVAMGGPFFEAASPATLSRTFVVCAIQFVTTQVKKIFAVEVEAVKS